jgi:hypothetical protein
MYSIISMEYSIINTLIYVDNNPFQNLSYSVRL